MPAKLDCYGMTDIGRKRRDNEDQFLVAELSKSMRIHQSSLEIAEQESIHGRSHGQVLIVADGMGGHRGGKRASQLAVESMVHYLLNSMPWTLDDSSSLPQPRPQAQTLKDAIGHCQESIEREGQAMPERAEMGTTFTMAYLVWPECNLLHVGDSRAYLFRNEQLLQLTQDQTVAEKLIQDGTIDSASSHPQLSHMLWGYLGVNADSLQPDLNRFRLQIGDTLLICSDGLIAHLDDTQLAEILSQNQTATETCQILVAEALSRGGSDNVTVVVAHVRDSDNLVQAKAASAAPSVDETQEFERIDPVSF